MTAPMKCVVLGLVLVLSTPAVAQPSEKLRSMLDRIFNSGEFAAGGRGGGGRRGGSGGGMRWADGGRAWDTIENREIVRYETATGNRRVLVSAADLTPKQTGEPLAITDYSWSADDKKLMVAVNPKRVLIRKNAADYWVLDRASHTWPK